MSWYLEPGFIEAAFCNLYCAEIYRLELCDSFEARANFRKSFSTKMDVDFEDLLSEQLNNLSHPQAAQAEAEIARRAEKRTLAVPTRDEDVRARLERGLNSLSLCSAKDLGTGVTA